MVYVLKHFFFFFFVIYISNHVQYYSYIDGIMKDTLSEKGGEVF